MNNELGIVSPSVYSGLITAFKPNITLKTIAETLNGRQYLSELTKDEEKTLEAFGFVVVFGYSDDNVELRGAIDEEISAYEGVTFYIYDGELLQNECEDEECPYYERLKEKATEITALWCEDGDESKYAWTFETDIPHKTFDIYEDDMLYCKGIVFSVKELKK